MVDKDRYMTTFPPRSGMPEHSESGSKSMSITGTSTGAAAFMAARCLSSPTISAEPGGA